LQDDKNPIVKITTRKKSRINFMVIGLEIAGNFTAS